jgi:hypothetical protein
MRSIGLVCLSVVAMATGVMASPTAHAGDATDGHDFISEARSLFVVGACAQGALPDGMDQWAANTVKAHCLKINKAQQAYRTKWVDKAEPFFAQHVPADAPKTVVYPFAGGDLSTALTVYPNADEITTLSLEPAGDPRSLAALAPNALRGALAKTSFELRFLYQVNFSNTKNMIESMRGGQLPTQLIFGLSALQIHGFEPVVLRYFRVEANGELHYLNDADIAAAGDPSKSKVARRNEFFGNVELQFRKVGGGRVQTYRHIQANLDDDHIKQSPGVFAYLDKKDKIAAMTKAASYLLSWDSFSKVRGFLLSHAQWMVSDATGVAPKWGKDGGFEYETWGAFENSHMDSGLGISKSWRDEFARQPKRTLSFRFGYYDSKIRNHMIIMRKKS